MRLKTELWAELDIETLQPKPPYFGTSSECWDYIKSVKGEAFGLVHMLKPDQVGELVRKGDLTFFHRESPTTSTSKRRN